MTRKVRLQRKVRLRSNEKGALEGLPLYLILLVVIAGVSTAIVFGWMQSAQSTELGHIEVDVGSDNALNTGKEQDITVKAYDQNNDPLSDTTVKLQGCGVKEVDSTNKDGTKTFRIEPSLPENEDFGELTVTVKYTGDITTEKTKIVTVKQ